MRTPYASTPDELSLKELKRAQDEQERKKQEEAERLRLANLEELLARGFDLSQVTHVGWDRVNRGLKYNLDACANLLILCELAGFQPFEIGIQGCIPTISVNLTPSRTSGAKIGHIYDFSDSRGEDFIADFECKLLFKKLKWNVEVSFEGYRIHP